MKSSLSTCSSCQSVGGTNLLAVNVAPCGSRRTVILTHGASSGGTRTSPPSSVAPSAVASASSTANVTPHCAGAPSSRCVQPRDRLLEAIGGADLLHPLAQAGIALLQVSAYAGGRKNEAPSGWSVVSQPKTAP